jgi:hypothetical protein
VNEHAADLPLIPNPSGPGVAPRFVPAPQPEGTVRVVLDEDYYEGDGFALYEDYPVLARPHDVFDIPAEQYEHWRAAVDAYHAVQSEIENLTSERAAALRGR